MTSNFSRQLAEYTQLNTVAEKGKCAFMGSTFMYQFPFSELCRLLNVDDTIYNRSVSGLRAEDAAEVYCRAVAPLKPSKLFINLGEEETTDVQSFTEHYRKLIHLIEETAPDTEIYLFPVFSADKEKCIYNAAIEALARETGVEFVDTMNSIVNSKGQIPESFFDDEKQLTMMAYISFWRKIYHYMRSDNITYYDAFNLSNAAMRV